MVGSAFFHRFEGDGNDVQFPCRDDRVPVVSAVRPAEYGAEAVIRLAGDDGRRRQCIRKGFHFAGADAEAVSVHPGAPVVPEDQIAAVHVHLGDVYFHADGFAGIGKDSVLLFRALC